MNGAAVTLAERVAISDRHDLTLNGKPARVVAGVMESVALVMTTDLTDSAKWAWGQIAGIVARGGAFRH